VPAPESVLAPAEQRAQAAQPRDAAESLSRRAPVVAVGLAAELSRPPMKPKPARESQAPEAVLTELE
jgi:hypothetical protein